MGQSLPTCPRMPLSTTCFICREGGMSSAKEEQTLRMSNLFGKKECLRCSMGEKRVYLKAKMWGGEEEGHIYLNQPVTLVPLQQKPKSSSNLWTLFSLKQNKKTQKTKFERKNIKK